VNLSTLQGIKIQEEEKTVVLVVGEDTVMMMKE